MSEYNPDPHRPRRELPQYYDPHRGVVDELERRYREAAERPLEPMHTPEELEARRAENKRQEYRAALGLITADPGIKAVAEPMLRQAMEERKRKVTDHGEFDSMTGTFKYFPQVRQQLDVERIGKQYDAARIKQGEGHRQWDAARQHDADQAALRLTLKTMGGQGSGEQKGSVTPYGNDPTTGELIYNHNRLGIVTRDPATGGFKPYQGVPGPKTNKPISERTTESLTASSANLDVLVKAIPAAQELAKGGWFTHAGATMGAHAGVLSKQGPFWEAMVSRMQPREVNNLRETVSNTIGLIRQGRYGMTLTAPEMADAIQYLPSQYSDAKDIVFKAANLARVLKAAHDRRVQAMESQRPGMPPMDPSMRAPEIPHVPGATPPFPARTQQGAPAMAGDLSPEEMAELERRRQQQGGRR